MPPTTAATVSTVVVCAVLGLVVGSFLNVVIYRSPRGQSVVRPASRCPQCGTASAGLENVPVLSWLALRGRCAHCHAPISVRYPVIESTTAGAFALIAWAVGPAAAVAPLLVVTGAALSAAAIELDGLVVPRLVWSGAAVGALGLVGVSLADHGAGRPAWGAAGALTATVAAVSWRRLGSLRPAPGRLVTVASLGWCAGWLWAPGGFAIAGLVAAAAAVDAVVLPKLAATPQDGRTADRVASWWHRVLLVAVTTGSFGVIVAGAAWHGP